MRQETTAKGDRPTTGNRDALAEVLNFEAQLDLDAVDERASTAAALASEHTALFAADDRYLVDSTARGTTAVTGTCI